MLDFCLTFPYAAALAMAAIYAWLTVGSAPSLIAGGGSSAVLGLAGLFSLRAFDQGKLCKPATAVSLAVALALTAKGVALYLETKEAAPALAVAIPSAAMVAFYVWCLVAGPEPSTAGKVVRRSTRTPTKRKAA